MRGKLKHSCTGVGTQAKQGCERSSTWLRIDGLRKVREQAGSRFELSVPAFEVALGELVAVVGESGCGKSTLLDLLALISRPDACERFELDFGGPVDVEALWRRGDEAALAGLRREALGYVLQTGGLLPYLSVRENLRLPCRLVGRDCERAIDETAERLGIADCLGRRPEKLSGGQRQRVAILRALIHRPRMVLADEPTAAVDRGRAQGIVAELTAIARDENTAVVMVTHDLALVEGVADRRYGFALEKDGEERTRSVCCEEAGGGS